MLEVSNFEVEVRCIGNGGVGEGTIGVRGLWRFCATMIPLEIDSIF